MTHTVASQTRRKLRLAIAIMIALPVYYACCAELKIAYRPLFHNWIAGGESMWWPWRPWAELEPVHDSSNWIAMFDWERNIIVVISNSSENRLSSIRQFRSAFDVVFLPDTTDAFSVSKERSVLIVKETGEAIQQRHIADNVASMFYTELIKNRDATIRGQIANIDTFGEYVGSGEGREPN